MEVKRNNKTKPKYSWLGKNSGFSTSKKTDETCEIDCICHRRRGLISCTNCLNSFIGRIATRCPVHPEIAYLMDARNCAFCGASIENLEMDQI